MELRFFDDPAEFLEVAGQTLAAEPVVSTVISGIADRIVEQRRTGVPWPEGVPCWFAAVLDGTDVVGMAMRTAPFGDYPAYLMPMSEAAVHLLSGELLDRGEQVLSANGALPAVQIFCDEMARATDQRAEVAQHTRLFELGELVMPPPVSGRLRPAVADEQDIVAGWFEAFMADADEQAGRDPGASAHERPTDAELERRIATGRTFVWVDEEDRPLHLTAASRPAYGVSRIGPVYTPREHRGRGLASRAVAEVSAFLRGNGERACLFTDQANPTSNKIYESIGYERVVDMANLQVV